MASFEPSGTSSTVKFLKPGSRWKVVQEKIVNRQSTKSEDNAIKWQNIVSDLKEGTAKFLGVSSDQEQTELMKAKWNARIKQLYGKKGWLALKESPDAQPGLQGDEEMRLMSSDGTDGRRSRRVPISLFIKPKENVLKMTYQAFKTDVQDVPSLKHRRSFAPSILTKGRIMEPAGVLDVQAAKFFDAPVSTGYKAEDDRRNIYSGGGFQFDGGLRSDVVLQSDGGFQADEGIQFDGGVQSVFSDALDGSSTTMSFLSEAFTRKTKIASIVEDEVDFKPVIADRIDEKLIEDFTDNGHREIGTGGCLGKYLIGIEKDERKMSKEMSKQYDAVGDVLHRPFFTYWVTFVQIVCYIVTICVYGLAPIGFHETNIEGEVLSSGLFVESVHYYEKDNFWIGPRQADLIHLGAKYSPCMRKDTNVEEAIMFDRVKENQTACCIRNDGSGCVQTPKERCSSIMSTWQKKEHGTVCGQDPNYCSAPASVEPYKWPDDIIQWPICTSKTVQTNGAPSHMTCALAGKPCCIGIQGECMVTTREHCSFMRGYFHEEAYLCSQISCMDETCGMLPFWNAERPDQFYRLWISLFIHAGLLQLIVSILFQLVYMRDVEKMMGWFRTSVIYLLSGVVGSLASAIFVPYHVEAGPSGSQFGILSCIFVEVISTWKYLYKPYVALLKLIFLLFILFILGFLPMIDNYAHLFGFVFGFLISFALMPHVELSDSDRRKNFIAVVACGVGSLVILLVLTLLFYIIPIYNCPYCQYFSCIPFTENFCDSMEVKIRRVSL